MDEPTQRIVRKKMPRNRICRTCGCEFVAHGNSTVCDDCRYKSSHAPTIIKHVCEDCGISFDGAPSAKCCPKCRHVRKQMAQAKRRKCGTSRPLGSTDACKACCKPYIVRGGSQRYCPACAKAETAKRIAARKAERYYAGEIVRAPRKAHFVCRICGKAIPLERSVRYTCSDACARELIRQMQRRADAKRRPRKQ